MPLILDIIVVEDDPQTAFALNHLLSMDGHVVGIAGTVGEARAKLAGDPTSVLLDLMLPGEDEPMGRTENLIEEIAARIPRCKIIVCTGLPAGSARVRALPRYVEVIHKPVDWTKLKASLPGPRPR